MGTCQNGILTEGKVSEWKRIRMEKCQIRNVSEMEGVRIGKGPELESILIVMCQQKKVIGKYLNRKGWQEPIQCQ